MFTFPFSFLSTQETGLDLLDNVYSMSFDPASNQYIQAGNISSLNNASAFSFSFWFKPNVLNVNHRIMSKYLNSNKRTTVGLFSTNFTINISQNGLQTGSVTYPTESPIPWKHIAVVFDGTKTGNANRVKCWFNAVPQTIDFGTSTIPSATANTGTKSFNIGALDTGSSILNPVNGSLDEVAIFNYAIESSDVENIYNATNDNTGKTADLSSMATPPVAWYRMGD